MNDWDNEGLNNSALILQKGADLTMQLSAIDSPTVLCAGMTG